jgi:hypothetical protein
MIFDIAIAFVTQNVVCKQKKKGTHASGWPIADDTAMSALSK